MKSGKAKIMDTSAVISLFQLIYSMLLSRLLTGMPLYGGAMYLVGYAAAGLLLVDGRYQNMLREKKQMRRDALLFTVILLAMMTVSSLLPFNAPIQNLWVLFALIMAITIRDTMGYRQLFLRQNERITEKRFYLTVVLMQLILLGTVCVLALPILSGRAAWLAVLGYLASALLSGYLQLRQYGRPAEDISQEQAEDARGEISSVNVARRFEVLSFLVAAGLQMTMVILYMLLATTEAQLIGAFGLSAGIIVAVSELMRRQARSADPTDPADLLIGGIALWLIGLLILFNMFYRHNITLAKGYLSQAFATAGAGISLLALEQLSERMEASLRFAQVKTPVFRLYDNELRRAAILCGQLLALLALALMMFLMKGDFPADLKFGDEVLRWQPLLLLPTLLMVFGALIGAMRLPLSRRENEKLGRLSRLSEQGEGNDALREQLKSNLIDDYKRPFLTHLIMAMMRPLFRQQIKDKRYVSADEENPVVFLCNHMEVYGPLVGMLFMPVPVRPWVISEICGTPEEFAGYFYTYTMSGIRFVPEFLKMPLSRLLGKGCIWLMGQLDAIPVYRNTPTKLMKTLRMSVHALEAGDSLLIYPENPNAESKDHGYHTDGIGPLFDGFASLAYIYYSKTGKRLTFVPMIVHRASRTMRFGPPVTFDPDNPSKEEERKRISDHAYREMVRMYEAEERTVSAKKRDNT